MEASIFYFLQEGGFIIMKLKKIISLMFTSVMCTIPLVNGIDIHATDSISYSDMPSEYITACDWVWDNRIYDDEHEDWMKDYSTIYDQLIAENGTIRYLIRWDSYQTITLEQRQQLENVLNDALNKWNDCLEGYENWPFDEVNVKIVGWSVLDENCLLDIQPDEIVYTETMDSTMRDYIIDCGMASDASSIPYLEPSEPVDISRYVHWSDSNWTYKDYDNRYDMFLESIDGLINMGGFGWHYGQYLSTDAILGLIDGTTSQHVLLHEMGHGFGFPDYYGGIGESDGIPPEDFPGGEGSIMEAGRSFEITSFDTWFARYAWTKLSEQEGRFDMSFVSEEPDINILKGDVNSDGEFTIADLVMLQKYLLRTSDITNWQAGDLYEDGILDAFDLCEMKKEFLNK